GATMSVVEAIPSAGVAGTKQMVSKPENKPAELSEPAPTKAARTPRGARRAASGGQTAQTRPTQALLPFMAEAEPSVERISARQRRRIAKTAGERSMAPARQQRRAG